MKRGGFRSDLQKNEVVFTTEVPRHLRKRFPVDAFVVDAESTPGWFVAKNLEQEWCDTRARFA
jgi:hypothetical protein